MSEDPLRWTHPDAEPPPEALALVRRLGGPPPLPPDLRGQVFGGTRAAIRRARWTQPGLGITAIAAGVALVWFVTPKDDPAERVASAAIAPEVAEESTTADLEGPEVTVALAIHHDAEARDRDAGARWAARDSPSARPDAGAPPRPASPAASEAEIELRRGVRMLAQRNPPRGPDTQAEARECVRRGDNACVIRLLEGHAWNPSQLESLIEAYRARGQTALALRHMRTYVRLADGPRARAYRQILEEGSDGARLAGTEWPATRPSPREPATVRAEHGYLTINTMPWARVFIDGRDTGRNTPVREMRLPAGRHTIGLRTNDGVMHAVQVTIGPGERERIVRRFEELEPPARDESALRGSRGNAWWE